MSPHSVSTVGRSGETRFPSVHFYVCLLPPWSLAQQRKKKSQSPSKLSLPWRPTSITEAERLWVRINTTLNLYTLLSNSIYLLSAAIFSV